MLSVLTVGRPNHFFAQRLTIVGFEVPRKSPHILIVPKGFAIESLQVLEPDVLELIRSQRILIELEGPSVRFMWPGFLPAARILPVLDAAARIKEILQGVAESELRAGPLSPQLRVGWLARTFSNITVKQLYFVLLAAFIIFAVSLAFSRHW